jgi:RNA polymerase sigma-70 factor (ECF subfamily)
MTGRAGQSSICVRYVEIKVYQTLSKTSVYSIECLGNLFAGQSSKALRYLPVNSEAAWGTKVGHPHGIPQNAHLFPICATHVGRGAQISLSSAPMGNQNEAETRPELRSGRPEAWYSLYDAHAESVWRLVARLIGPARPEVADVVQETFLAAARSARQFDESRGSPRAWLCGIARLQVALHFRRAHRQARLLTGEGRPAVERERMIEWIEGLKESPADVLSRAETVVAVRVALATLAEPHAAALVARYFDGADVEQMARDEGCATTAIRSRLARARKAFCRALGGLTPCAADVDAGDQHDV